MFWPWRWDEDPFYNCQEPLQCANTYAERVRNPDGGAPLVLPLFVCRQPCPAGGSCSNGEVCCEGLGPSREVVRTCVPEQHCEAMVRDR